MSESRESRMVTLRRKPDGTPAVWCDPEIVDLVSALNAGGVPTVASCSGHGERPGNIALADGRELIIAKDYAEARAIEAAWNTRPAPTEAEVLAVQVLDLLRTGKDGRKFDCIESRAGALVNVAHFFGESK